MGVVNQSGRGGAKFSRAYIGIPPLQDSGYGPVASKCYQDLWDSVKTRIHSPMLSCSWMLCTYGHPLNMGTYFAISFNVLEFILKLSWCNGIVWMLTTTSGVGTCIKWKCAHGIWIAVVFYWLELIQAYYLQIMHIQHGLLWREMAIALQPIAHVRQGELCYTHTPQCQTHYIIRITSCTPYSVLFCEMKVKLGSYLPCVHACARGKVIHLSIFVVAIVIGTNWPDLDFQAL